MWSGGQVTRCGQSPRARRAAPACGRAPRPGRAAPPRRSGRRSPPRSGRGTRAAPAARSAAGRPGRGQRTAGDRWPCGQLTRQHRLVRCPARRCDAGSGPVHVEPSWSSGPATVLLVREGAGRPGGRAARALADALHERRDRARSCRLRAPTPVCRSGRGRRGPSRGRRGGVPRVRRTRMAASGCRRSAPRRGWRRSGREPAGHVGGELDQGGDAATTPPRNGCPLTGRVWPPRLSHHAGPVVGHLAAATSDLTTATRPWPAPAARRRRPSPATASTAR